MSDQLSPRVRPFSVNARPWSSLILRAMKRASSHSLEKVSAARSPATKGCASVGFIAFGSRRSRCPTKSRAKVTMGDDSTEVLLEPHLPRAGVSLGEAEDVLHVGAVPLEDGLVVVADDGQRGAEVGEGANDLLLQRVGVLVLVDDDVPDPRASRCPASTLRRSTSRASSSCPV
jgi:hypothetical protein